MAFEYPDENTAGKAYQARVRREYEAVDRRFPDPDDEDQFRHFMRYGFSSGRMPEGEAANKHIAELRADLQRHHRPAPGPSQPPTVARRPLVGRVRVENKLIRDDTGYRRVFFDSWFTALRMLRHEPDRFYRWLDGTVRAGFQGSRIFLSVGGWEGFWSGYGVYPVGFRAWQFDRKDGHLRPATDAHGQPKYGATIDPWPDFDDLWRTLLREYRKRQLRLHVSFGDCQIITPDPQVEIELHQRCARIAAEEGGADVVALWEVTNEYPMNRYGSDRAGSITQMGRVIAAVRPILPGVLMAQGAPLSEEPEKLREAAMHGDVCISHTSRDPFEFCLKRTHALVYWEGEYRAFPKPFIQGEPKGPNVLPFGDNLGDDMYSPLTHPSEAVALYAMHALTGQWSNFFDGGAVRSTAPSADAWGYDELPALFDAHIPEDVATWDHGSNRRGGIEYWWKGDQFLTSTWKGWDPSPPRPIAEWTFYTGDNVTHGTGTPPPMTGLLVGRFA